MEDAAEKLKDLVDPQKKSYTADIGDLAYRSAEYSILGIDLGDTITLIDRKTGIRDKQRITKITEYPGNPDKIPAISQTPVRPSMKSSPA